MTVAEMLWKEGYEEGHKEGYEEGYKEGFEIGTLEGRHLLFLAQLRMRFGVLPEAVMMRVRVANTAQLDLWTERMLTASTVEEVLGET